MATWKKYGGRSKTDNLNSVSVRSFAADTFTLRNSYVGTFDITGELHVSGDATSDSTIYGNDLVIKHNIYADRLFVKTYTLQFTSVDVSGILDVNHGNTYLHQHLEVDRTATVRDKLILGESANGNTFLFGNTNGKIGVNTINPQSSYDILSSNTPFGFNVRSTTEQYLYTVPTQNVNGQGIVMKSNVADSKIEFYVDNTIQSGTPDGLIQYTSGGNLTIDVSNNINLLATLAISKKANVAPHMLNESVVIYDTPSPNPYLNLIYENNTDKLGEALTLVSNDANSMTFMNIITPNKMGVAFGGGAYPNDQTRSLATIGCLDTSANFTPAMNILSGNSTVHQKTTLGINTHSPETEKYTLDVNGPTHIKNGEITITAETDFEILALTIGKTAQSRAIAVGTASATSNPYRQTFLQTTTSGELWSLNRDLSGGFIEDTPNNVLNSAFVYDGSLSVVAGGVYAYISHHETTGSIFKDIFLPEDLGYINAVYVVQSPTTAKVRILLAQDGSIYWFDFSYNSIFLAENIESRAGDNGSFSLPLTRSRAMSMDGVQNSVWMAVDDSILKIDPVAKTATTSKTNPGKIYKSIRVYSSNIIVATGQGVITYTKNGGTTWTDYTTPYTVASVGILDASRAVAVCNGGVVIYTTDGFASWQTVPYDILNSSGNADRLIDPNYNLTKIEIVDIANFYITKQIRGYNLMTSTAGKTHLFHLYLPNLFNRSNNIVLDISGCARISGDMNINDGGKIASNNAEFSLLNEGVKTLYIGNDASAIFVGKWSTNSNVVVNSDLSVVGNSVLNQNLTVANNAFVLKNATVSGETFLLANVSVGANLYVANNANIGGNLDVLKTTTLSDATIRGNLTVARLSTFVGNATFSNTITVVGNATMNRNLHIQGNLNVDGNALLSGNLTVSQNATLRRDLTIAGNANVSSNLFVANNANITKQAYVGDTLYVAGNITTPGNLTVANANVSTLLVRNATVSNEMRMLGNANISNTLYVAGTATAATNLNVLGNASVAKNLNITGETTATGNISSANYINSAKSFRAPVYDGPMVVNAGVLNADFDMGVKVDGLDTRNIKIGNFEGDGTINNIFIGGSLDNIVIGGTVVQNSDLKAGAIMYLNTPIILNGTLVGDNTSAYSGIVIAEGLNTSAGFIKVPSDKNGYIMRATNPASTNTIKLDIVNSTLPAGYGSGLMTLVPSQDEDSDYKMVVGTINPNNIVLGNHSISTNASLQVIDSSLSVLGHVSIGALPTTANCALEITGDIFHTGQIIQF
jgi:predicted acyltransferase (DUF342 family)